VVFLGKHPFASRFGKNRRPLGLATLWSLPLVAAAAAVLVFAPFPSSNEDRVKGSGLSLLVYHKTATGAELLAPPATLAAGEEVQLAYTSAQRRWVAIYSVDSRENLTVHLPLDHGKAILVAAGTPTLLPYSYRLDDAPSFELFAVVAAESEFSVDQITPFVLAYAQGKTTDLALPAGFSSTTFRVLKKESRP
jgi:hypothetical protein